MVQRLGSGLVKHKNKDVANATSRLLSDILSDSINARDLGVKGDGATDDIVAIRGALITAANARKTIYFPDGTYLCSDFFSIPSHSRVYCSPGAVFKLTARTNLGGFVVTGMSNSVIAEPCEDVVTYNLTLDCSSIAGENGINGVSCKRIYHYNPTVMNTLHHKVARGGRAFQCEGGHSSDVHVFNAVFRNCSIGVNYQGLPDGTQTVVGFSFHNIAMENVDIPFSIYSQVSNPDTQTPEIASVAVFGISCHNCGKISGGYGDQLGGGIVCGDRGYGLFVDGLRVVNDQAYGGIGAIVRGQLFGVSLNNVDFYGRYAVSVLDFNKIDFDEASVASNPSTVRISNMKVSADLDFIVRSPDSGNIGDCVVDVAIDVPKATLNQLFDAQSGVNTSCVINIKDAATGKETGLRTIKDLYEAGNSVGLITRIDGGGLWRPVDASGGNLELDINGPQRFHRKGDIINFSMNLTIPVNSDGNVALIGGLPASLSSINQFAGSASIAIKSSDKLVTVGILPTTGQVQFFGATGIALNNQDLSGTSIVLNGWYFAS